MEFKVYLGRADLILDFGPDEVNMAETTGFLEAVSKNYMVVVFDDEELELEGAQQEQFLSEYLKHPSEEFIKCLWILAWLVKKGLVKEASPIMKNTLKQLREQLLSLGNQKLGMYTTDL